MKGTARHIHNSLWTHSFHISSIPRVPAGPSLPSITTLEGPGTPPWDRQPKNSTPVVSHSPVGPSFPQDSSPNWQEKQDISAYLDGVLGSLAPEKEHDNANTTAEHFEPNHESDQQPNRSLTIDGEALTEDDFGAADESMEAPEAEQSYTTSYNRISLYPLTASSIFTFVDELKLNGAQTMRKNYKPGGLRPTRQSELDVRQKVKEIYFVRDLGDSAVEFLQAEYSKTLEQPVTAKEEFECLASVDRSKRRPVLSREADIEESYLDNFATTFELLAPRVVLYPLIQQPYIRAGNSDTPPGAPKHTGFAPISDLELQPFPAPVEIKTPLTIKSVSLANLLLQGRSEDWKPMLDAMDDQEKRAVRFDIEWPKSTATKLDTVTQPFIQACSQMSLKNSQFGVYSSVHHSVFLMRRKKVTPGRIFVSDVNSIEDQRHPRHRPKYGTSLVHFAWHLISTQPALHDKFETYLDFVGMAKKTLRPTYKSPLQTRATESNSIVNNLTSWRPQ